jgi:hypothetical protein
MQIDQVAQRFARRKDFELVDFAMVALPMYAITLDCVCCVHRPFPPMSLFALRAIKASITNEAGVASFLGLEITVTRTILRELVQDRYLVDAGVPDHYELTETGRQIVEEERQYVPLEETHSVIYDGILRRPVWLSGERLLRPSEIDRGSTIEIRPYPGLPPELPEIRLPDIVTVLKSRYGTDEFDRDVLALSRIARRSKVFRLATGLAYRMKNGPEIQIAFVIDGVPHKELEQVFAEKGGARKMGFIKALSEVGVERAVKKHLGNDIVQLLPEDSELQGRRQILAGARLGLEIAARHSEASNAEINVAKLEDARSRFAEAVRSIQTFQARPLDVYETGQLVRDALETATTRIFVAVSESWITVVNRDFVRSLEEKLKRGVDIRILEFVRAEEDSQTSGVREKLGEIVRIGGKYRNLRVTRSKRRGFHFLIKDSQFAAIANRPILGPASKTRMFHQFSGFLLQTPALTDAYAARVTDLHWKEESPPPA